MTKAELIAALAGVSDDAVVYIDQGDGILRTHVEVNHYEQPDRVILEARQFPRMRHDDRSE